MLWILSLCLLLLGVRESTVEAQATNLKPTIRALHIYSDIKYRYATTLVSSRVVNLYSQAAEAAFTVTLPDSAFISEFLMDVNGNVYQAYVKDKDEAKSVYKQAKKAGQSAGHVALSARDSNQFTVSVNIEAQGKVTFNLTYEQLLPRDLGVYTNTININPQQIVEEMLITVNIEEPTTIKKFEVFTSQMSNGVESGNEQQNAIQVQRKEISPKHKQVIWKPTPEQQKTLSANGVHGQLIVLYDVDHKEDPQNILVDEGYFVHFFAPENLPKLKKHVVFVLDYSYSMEGRKIEQLKDAMNTILLDLDRTDYFSIVIFYYSAEAWSLNKIQIQEGNKTIWKNAWIPSSNTVLDRDFIIEASTGNIYAALAYLNNYTVQPSTNILGGLRKGLELVKIGSDQWINESDAPHPIMVFLTDGQPNVEETNTDVIIKKTKDRNVNECPIYSLAFGYGADFNFLRKLSLSNYGFARKIYEAADASDQLKNFYKTVSSPLLSNVTFNYLPGQVDISSSTRSSFNNFYKGSELVVAGKVVNGRLKTKNRIGELSGVTASGLRTYPMHITKSAAEGHLEKTWAYLTIKQSLDIADSLDDGTEKDNLKEKAKKLALQYSFVTPLTSLVVVKPNEAASAVDTTKVKPGATSASVKKVQTQISTVQVSSSLEDSQEAVGGSPKLDYAIDPRQLGVDIRFGVSLDDSITTEHPPRKIPLSDVIWLQSFLTGATSGSIKVWIRRRKFNLAMNKTDRTFGNCKVNYKSGKCHHFQYCALNIFKNNVTDFIPYRCPIPGNYLGVCCPEGVL